MGRSNQGNTCMPTFQRLSNGIYNSKTEVSLHVNDDSFLTCH